MKTRRSKLSVILKASLVLATFFALTLSTSPALAQEAIFDSQTKPSEQIWARSTFIYDEAKLDHLIDVYFKALDEEEKAEESKNKYTLENVQVTTQIARLELVTYFEENFFKRAYKSHPELFPSREYELALKKIQFYVQSHPEKTSLLAMNIHSLWHRHFYDIYQDEYMRRFGEQDERMGRVHLILTILTAIPSMGQSLKGHVGKAGSYIFKFFKVAHPKAAVKSVQVVAEQGSIAAGKIALKQATIAGGITMVGMAGAAFGIKPEVKEMPVPPAQFITLAQEPVEITEKELNDHEMLQTILSSTAGSVAGWVTFALIAARGGRIAVTIGSLKALIVGILIGAPVGYYGEKGVKHLIASSYRNGYRKDLAGALKIAEEERETATPYNQLRNVLSVTRGAQMLSGFHRHKVLNEEQDEEVSQEVLGHEVIAHFLEMTVDNNGKIVDEALETYLDAWKSNAAAAQAELDRRNHLANSCKKARWKYLGFGCFATVIYHTVVGESEVLTEDQKNERLIMESIPEITLKSIIQLTATGFGILGNYRALTATDPSLTFGAYLRSLLDEQDKRLSLELARGEFRTDPDEVIFQTAGYLRLFLKNKDRHNYSAAVDLLSREFQLSTTNGGHNPLLFTRLIPRKIGAAEK